VSRILQNEQGINTILALKLLRQLRFDNKTTGAVIAFSFFFTLRPVSRILQNVQQQPQEYIR
jgi:hypothetical protein